MPGDAPDGRYTFRPDVVAVANPDEDSTTGPTLAFEVPAVVVVVEPWWRRYLWPLVAAAVALLVLIGVLAYLFYFNVVSFSDDFGGTTFDTSRWQELTGQTGIQVSGGFLQISGSRPVQERINSVDVFAVPVTTSSYASITAEARIGLDGDYQKVGFNVNGVGAQPVGAYFDTLEGRFGVKTDFVHAVIYDASRAQNIFDSPIPTTWGTFHDLAVTISASDVSFSLDGQEVGRQVYVVTGAPPIGVWSDGASLMQIDWVRVSGRR